MAIDPGTTLILITCLICTIVLAFAGKETGDKTDTKHDNESANVENSLDRTRDAGEWTLSYIGQLGRRRHVKGGRR